VTRGINAIEVIGDKSRDMLFDNAKIRAAVPEFTGKITLGEALGEIAAYFEGNADARRVNYAWDGQADHMLAHSGLLTPAQEKTLRFCDAGQATADDLCAYNANR
jgi:hypothetical protein